MLFLLLYYFLYIRHIYYLESLYKKLGELGFANKVTFDLGMVPRLDYYTGIIFKGYADGVGATVLSGGRYDNLMSTFGVDAPAIGFSFNLDNMLNVIGCSILEETEKYKVYYNKKDEVMVLKKAMYLRNEGKIVELCPREDIDTIEVEKEVIKR